MSQSTQKLNSVGDFFRKSLEQVDFRRVGNFFFMGACVVAPCVRTWLITLDRLVKAQGDHSNAAISVADPGSGAFLTPGSGLNIPDPQH
jgi:hypothetical protein